MAKIINQMTELETSQTNELERVKSKSSIDNKAIQVTL